MATDPGQNVTLPAAARLVANELREGGDDGRTLAELEVAAGTRWALRVIRQMNRAGFNIGEMGARYVLVHEPAPSEQSAPFTPSVDVASPTPADRSLGAGEQLALLGSTSRMAAKCRG